MTNNSKEKWCQVRETILMINVAVARIEHAMLEGNDSFTSLSQSFVEIVEFAGKITTEVNNLEDSPTKIKIDQNCNEISQRINNSIIAFQFYDRLSQRMSMVSKTLNSLTEVLDDPDKMNIKEEWLKLQNTIRSKYTLDADQKMFDDVLSGMPIDEALKIALNTAIEENDDIEFF